MALSKIDPAGLDIGQIGGRRNLIINGAMQVAQRGTSATVSNGYNALDRVYTFKVHDGAVTESQSTDTPSSEFYYSLKHEVDTADTSIGATQYHALNWRIEGYDASRLGFGASGAKSCALSFWVKSSVTGDYGVCLRNAANNRFNMRTMTINAADTWEQKTITFTGDTAGTWLKTNGNGLGVQISMAMGTDFQGTSADTWVTNVDVAPATQVNWLNTVGNTFYLTGLQLELGNVATPFEHRSYGEELALCQRYYQQIKGQNLVGTGAVYSSGLDTYIGISLKQTMRANPTVSWTTGTDYWRRYSAGNASNFSSLDGTQGLSNGTDLVMVYYFSNVGSAGSAAWLATNNANAVLSFSAEL